MSASRPKLPALATFERVAWRSGLVLTAVLLPLDRLPQTWARPLLWLSLLLLLVRPVVALLQPVQLWQQLLRRRALVASGVLGGVVVAAWLSVPGALDRSMAAGAAITLTWLLLRAWLLALWLDKADLVLLAKAVIISGLGVALLGWLQAAADLAGWPASITGLLPRYSHTATYIIPRPQSVALEPLYLAHYLLIPLGLLVAYWLSRRRRLAAAAGLTITSLIVATGSRGGLLGLMALTSLAIIASLWRRPQARKAGMIIALTGGVAALALGLVIWRQYQSRPVAKDVKVERTWRSALAHYVDFNDRSANTRYELWPAAVAQWRQHPWTGVGLYNSRLALHPAAVAAGVPVEQLQPFNNDYLAWLAETGLAGMAAALGLGAVLVLAARQLWRQWSMWGSGWSLALAGMAVQALTFHSLLLLRTWVVVGALLGAFVAQQATKRDEVAL